MVVQRQVFRSFWHGSPLSPYQLLCLRSFVDRGHTVEVFTHGRELSVPDWVQQRDAHEIFPTDHVLHYQSGFGAGSPSLHSNLFRYMMLQQLGGWWIPGGRRVSRNSWDRQLARSWIGFSFNTTLGLDFQSG
jgi:hypothetical protein